MGIEPAIVQAVVTGLIAGGVSTVVVIGGMRVHLHYLRRDVDRAHRRIDTLEARHHGTTTHQTP